MSKYWTKEMQAQKEEFDAADELSKALNNLPPIVDDDYPAMRHEYEGAVRTFLKACKANGRLEPDGSRAIYALLTDLSKHTHKIHADLGWWTDLSTGEPKERNVGELLCLVHSEISEAMEGHRKNLMDDHLPHRTMFEVELADAIIRIFDLAGHHNLDLGGAVAEKLVYNQQRADHKLENRKLAGGKAY